jgi:glutamate-ammonia-ligase adenylyltransferase
VTTPLHRALEGNPLASRLATHGEPFIRTRGQDVALGKLDDAAAAGLARVVASQPEFAGFLSHRPAFLEGLAPFTKKRFAERTTALENGLDAILELELEDALDALRLRRREEMAYAACVDLAGLCPFPDISDYLSILAETTLRTALGLAQRELRMGEDEGFAVIGMGKLAGRELTYHSDLDLIFLFRGGAERIAKASRLGQRLIAYLTTMTGAGVAYPVDTRLRPSGNQGMLVTSFESFERYQTETAAQWEHLAQLRARAVAGVADGDAALRRVRDLILAQRTKPWSELGPLRDRVENERASEASGAQALKTSAGGLMDVDFLAGGGLLERGTERFPSLPSVPAMLTAAASGPAVEALVQDYRFLRLVESRLRWVHGRGDEAIAEDDPELPVIAELTKPGLSPDALRAQIDSTRRQIRARFAAVLAADSISALEAE